MQGIPFAVEVFAIGVGLLDWLVFNGHFVSATLRLVGL